MNFDFLKIDDLIDQPAHLIVGFLASLLLTWLGVPVILSVIIMMALAFAREVWQKYTDIEIFTIKDALKKQFRRSPGSWFDLLFFLIGGILCIAFHEEVINFLSHLLGSF